MSPGRGGARLACCVFWLFLLLHRGGQGSPLLEAEGNVGCVYSDLVCADDELCFDDGVIGRCVSASSNDPQIERHARWAPMQGPALALLEAEMTRVFGLGYSWPDIYTQCVFQTLLHHIQTGQSYSEHQCSQLRSAQRLLPVGDQDEQEEEEPREDERNEDEHEEEEDDNIPEIIEDREGNIYIPEDSLQYLRGPSEEDEVGGTEFNNFYLPENLSEDEDEDEEMTPEEQEKAWWQLRQVLQNLHDTEDLNPLYEDSPEEDQMVYISPEDLFLTQEDSRLSLPPRFIPLSHNFIPPSPKYVPQSPFFPKSSHSLGKREVSSFNLRPLQPVLQFMPAPEDTQYIVPDDLFHQQIQNTPLHKYEQFDTNDIDSQEPTEEEEDTDWNPDNDEELVPIVRHQKRQSDTPTLMDELYNTGDADKDISNYDFDYQDSAAAKNDDDDILYYNPDNEPIAVESVFDRRERLDVKKPGPFFSNSPNNFFLDKLLPEDFSEKHITEEDGAGQTEYEFPLSPQSRPKNKKDVQPLLTIPEGHIRDDILTIHYNRMDLETQADRLVMFIADHLGLQPTAFSLASQPESSRLVLSVHANPRNLNASAMAGILNADTTLAEHANRDLGINIKSFEAGNKDEVISIATSQKTSGILLVALLVCTTLAAIASVAGLLLIIRRRAKSLNKTKAVNDEDKEEPVKEYKQLVRDWSRSSRASQSSVTNGAGGAEAGQVSPLPPKRAHKISQNSEGSRTSSTSSWQEEPTATSMDISTGHMVLSYMEDHLKNKQRLEQEWVGLCAYEAEPNSTAVAFKVENKKKNRYPDKLPYDHNRVLLNALVNGTNSDYINASTVMDHDPRNPAYIITQGPMAHTVADFWQMVWEQGSVVIVMLSRLSENGYQLVQRYWPEEGSEQYHIFEVHLVSEHVWCEDYLVRSLYLKNSQTGETRTVTQFHFLSWPDATIPTSTRAILEFRRKVNKSYRGRSCPMIIHCSDGVGRSGTYVLIDMVLNRMTKGSKEIDIAATLEHIRDQRSGMVQTRSQFEFCLMAVAEETHAILKALPQ